MDKLQIFQNSEFGQIRTQIINDKIYFVANDIATILGYTKPRNAISLHCRYALKQGIPHPQSINKTLEVNLIPESDVLRLIINSKLPAAEKFENWVFDEVLPTLLRTGSYSMKSDPKELELKEKEIQLKTAEFLNNMADSILIPEYKQILNAHATKVLTGDFLLPLPVVGEITYSATEIGKMLGISANMVGRLTKKHNLRTEEYGKVFYDKSKYSSKEVETFRYYIKVIDILKNIVSTLSA